MKRIPLRTLPSEKDAELPGGSAPFIVSFNVSGVAAYAKGMAGKGLSACGSEGNPKPKVHPPFRLLLLLLLMIPNLCVCGLSLSPIAFR